MKKRQNPESADPRKAFNFFGIRNFLYRFQSSLSFIVVSLMVVLAIIPVALVSAGNYYRTRAFLQEQTTAQLQNFVQSQSGQLLDLSNKSQLFITSMLEKVAVQDALNNLMNEPANPGYRYIANYQLGAFLQANIQSSETNVDGVFILSPSGKIISSSKPEWNDLDLSGSQLITEIANTSKSFGAFSPSALYANQWAVFSSRPLVNEKGGVIASVVITAFPRAPRAILETASALFQGGKAFLVTFDHNLAGINARSNQIEQKPISSSYGESINQIFTSRKQQGGGLFEDPDLSRVFAYARWLPEMNMGMVVEMPESMVYRQIDALIPFTLLFIGISLGFISIVVFFGARSLVGPIVQLTQNARSFAKGDWSARSTIRRRDEVGVLAATFNQMVEQISDLYRSLEQKVEERSRQLRTASEIGQLATSASSREEILERAVKLVIDRFGYSYASIFLIDQSGNSGVLMAAYSQSGEMKNQKGYRVSVSSETLVGWVAKNRQSRVVSDLNANEFTRSEIVLIGSRAEAALPVAVGNQMIGVFEVQSLHAKSFEPENVSVLQTISNQIATGLQNLRLLEATQINLEETALLYRASQQITLTQSKPEMLRAIQETLVQTPYVSGIFSVADDCLSIEAILDPQNPNSSSTVQGITLPLQRMILQLAENPYILIEDLSAASEFNNLLSFFSRRGCRSAAIFGISNLDHLTDVILLGSRDANNLNATTMQPFSSLVEVISTTNQRFQVLSNLQDRVTTLQTLNKVSEAINGQAELMALYQTLHGHISQVVGYDISFLIALLDSEKNQIEIPYVFENDELISFPSFPLGEGLTSVVIQSRQPLMIVKDAEQRAKELGAKISGKPAKSWLGVPLLLAGQAIGAIILQDRENEERFTQNDLNLFTALAPQIATAVRNAQLLTQMQTALHAYDQERFLLNTLMANIPDQVFFKDQDGRYLRVSQSYAEQLGESQPVQVEGRMNSDLMEPARADEINAVEEAVIEAGQPVLGMVEKKEADGQAAWSLNSKIPMTDPGTGQKAGLMGISRDITELKQAEQTAQDRARELEIAAEIARDTSGTLELPVLLANAVNLIRERFGYYHASIFLVDSLGQYAVLRESTGEVGVQMKQRGHRLAVGSESIVGQATESKKPWVINDVSKEPWYFANPLLPDTKSELVIPLIVGERVLGAVDVQSQRLGAFSPGEVQILQILADQLAIAVWNSILFGQTQETLAQHRLLHQITIAASAATSSDDVLAVTVNLLHQDQLENRVMILMLNQGNLQVSTAAGYEGYDLATFTFKPGEGIPGKVFLSRQPLRINDLQTHPEVSALDPNTRSELTVPIYFSDRTLGVLDLCSTQVSAYDETDQEILSSLGNTLGAILANNQLVREVRQQVERQQLLFEVTSRIRRTTDIQTILETSAKEIARTVGARRAEISIQVEPTPSNSPEKHPTSPKNGKGAAQ